MKNLFLEDKLNEHQSIEVMRANAAYDKQLDQDFLKLLEAAYGQPGSLSHLAKSRAPEAFVRVGPKAA